MLTEQIKRTWPEYFELTTPTLTNGDKLIRRYGKYNPGLCFLVNEKNNLISWYDGDYHHIDLNLEFDTSVAIEWMPGDFWVSKSGTSCFRPDENGKHVLIKVNWGGSFDPSRGTEYEEVSKLAIYSRRAESNGGGCGYNYYVFPKDYHRELDIDDI